LPTGGGAGAGGGAALGAELGRTAEAVGFAELLLLDVLLEGPHMATHNAMTTMTPRIANWISRRLFEMVGIDVSPIADLTCAIGYPPERGF